MWCDPSNSKEITFMIKLIRIVILLTFFTTNLFSNTDQELYKKLICSRGLRKIRKEYVEDIDQFEMIDSCNQWCSTIS